MYPATKPGRATTGAMTERTQVATQDTNTALGAEFWGICDALGGLATSAQDAAQGLYSNANVGTLLGVPAAQSLVYTTEIGSRTQFSKDSASERLAGDENPPDTGVAPDLSQDIDIKGDTDDGTISPTLPIYPDLTPMHRDPSQNPLLTSVSGADGQWEDHKMQPKQPYALEAARAVQFNATIDSLSASGSTNRQLIPDSDNFPHPHAAQVTPNTLGLRRPGTANDASQIVSSTVTIDPIPHTTPSAAKGELEGKIALSFPPNPPAPDSAPNQKTSELNMQPKAAFISPLTSGPAPTQNLQIDGNEPSIDVANRNNWVEPANTALPHHETAATQIDQKGHAALNTFALGYNLAKGFAPTIQDIVQEQPVQALTLPGDSPLSISNTSAVSGTVLPHSTRGPLGKIILAHAQNNTGEALDLQLAPLELGQLRIRMQTTNDMMHVVISAERGETLELMRRNSEQLLQELRQSGFAHASLSFGQWGGEGSEQARRFVEHTVASGNQPPDPDTTSSPTPRESFEDGSSGLNLRF